MGESWNAVVGRYSATILGNCGSREQKERWLNRCPGFDPEGWDATISRTFSGGGVALRAEWNGDDWLLTGSIGMTRISREWAVVVLVRTDFRVPVEDGLTLFVLDCSSLPQGPTPDTAGTAIRELAISDSHRIGDVGGGWRICALLAQ